MTAVFRELNENVDAEQEDVVVIVNDCFSIYSCSNLFAIYLKY